MSQQYNQADQDEYLNQIELLLNNLIGVENHKRAADLFNSHFKWCLDQTEKPEIVSDNAHQWKCKGPCRREFTGPSPDPPKAVYCCGAYAQYLGPLNRPL